MSWKIVVNSDQCPHAEFIIYGSFDLKIDYSVGCAHPNAEGSPCEEWVCPIIHGYPNTKPMVS